MPTKVAVLGAGVAGLTSALAIKLAFPEFDVSVFAEEFSPNTTGDGSAGIWGPYLLADTPPEDVTRWAGRTHRWFKELWKAGLAAETGIALIPVYRLTKDDPDEFASSLIGMDLVYGAQPMTEAQLHKFRDEHRTDYRAGWQYLTFTGEPIRLLPWLLKQFLAEGGTIFQRRIRSLEEPDDEGYDLTINCCGLGARDLANDVSVVPIRGQVARVEAPWLMHTYMIDDDDGNYVIPNIGSVVLGGTHQTNDFDRMPRKDDSELIFGGCSRLVPGLKKAKLLREWVGLRPGRPRVRLEAEVKAKAIRSRDDRYRHFTVIHNYGHGGSGVTLCWGCALDVVRIVKETLSGESKAKL